MIDPRILGSRTNLPGSLQRTKKPDDPTRFMSFRYAGLNRDPPSSCRNEPLRRFTDRL